MKYLLMLLSFVILNSSVFAETQIYMVKAGDTLSGIKSNENIFTSYAILGEWNNLNEKYEINVGQKLFLTKPSISDIYNYKVVPLKKKLEIYRANKSEDKATIQNLIYALCFLAFILFMLIGWLRQIKNKTSIQSPADNTKILAEINKQFETLKDNQTTTYQKISKDIQQIKIEESTDNDLNQNVMNLSGDLKNILNEKLKSVEKLPEIQQTLVQSIENLGDKIAATTENNQTKEKTNEQFLNDLDQEINQMPQRIEDILNAHKAQVLIQQAEKNFLLKEWHQCEQQLTSFKLDIIDQALKEIVDYLIAPKSADQDQNYRNLSRTIAGLDEILYWYQWLILPLDNDLICQLNRLISLTRLITLQQKIAIEPYVLTHTVNPSIDLTPIFEKIEKLCGKINLLDLISDNILDLLLLLTAMKAIDADKEAMIQNIFGKNVILPIRTDIQASRGNRHRIYHFTSASLIDLTQKNKITSSEIKQY